MVLRVKSTSLSHFPTHIYSVSLLSRFKMSYHSGWRFFFDDTVADMNLSSSLPHITPYMVCNLTIKG